MKNLKTLIAVVTLSLTTLTISAREGNPETKDTFRKEIISLLGNKVSLSSTNKTKEMKAVVKLLVNNNNELVVIDTRTNNTTLDLYVKSRLNYKKVKTKGLKKGEVYTVPLTIKQS